MRIRFAKFATIFLAVGIFFSAVAFAEGRKDIDTFLKSYEEFVVEAEKTAAKKDLLSIMQLQTKSVEFADKVGKLNTSGDWTAKDLQKYTELTTRYTKAMSGVMK
ncbi:MAG: hypothetical protein SO116_08140 [Treponema sp.]|nr:hypothetical protein [Spirochaetia bacterium]MDY4902821.1 hypothetical protein [Treponema sp.]